MDPDADRPPTFETEPGHGGEADGPRGAAADTSLVVSPSGSRPLEVLADFVPIAQRNPYLVYLGGLDRASHPTMVSAARMAVRVLSSGRHEDPVTFPWHTLDYAVVTRMRSLLREQENLASRTVDKVLTLVRGVMRQAWLLGYVTDDVFHKILEVKSLNDVRLGAGRYVESGEVAELLRVCREAGDARGLRDAAVFSILVGAGLREKEAVKLSVADYDRRTKVVRVRFGKGRKQREAYLVGAFAGVINLWLAAYEASEGDPLFPRISPRGTIVRPPHYVTTQAVILTLAKRAQEAKIRALTPHDLRRTFITNQLKRGVDPLRLARAVGHENPNTTMLYDRRTAESDRLAITGDVAEEEKVDVDAALLEVLASFKKEGER